MQQSRKPTPEELRWKQAVFNPEKLKRNLRIGYILCGIILPIFVTILIYACITGFEEWWITLTSLTLTIGVIMAGIHENRRALSPSEQGSPRSQETNINK